MQFKDLTIGQTHFYGDRCGCPEHNMPKKQQKKGIDLKQFKKWILKNIGKKCPDYCWDCIVCRTWRLYDDLEAYEDYMKILDKWYDIKPKKAKPHNLGDYTMI